MEREMCLVKAWGVSAWVWLRDCCMARRALVVVPSFPVPLRALVRVDVLSGGSKQGGRATLSRSACVVVRQTDAVRPS